VAFCARTPAHVAAVEAELRGRGPAAVHGAVADVADAPRLAAWIDRAAAAMGGLDAVVVDVSAAGGGGGVQDWRTSLETDLLGAQPGLARHPGEQPLAGTGALSRRLLAAAARAPPRPVPGHAGPHPAGPHGHGGRGRQGRLLTCPPNASGISGTNLVVDGAMVHRVQY